MDIVEALILGIIEGITEFLPVSSTGHLIVVSHFMDIAQTETNKAFEVIIQLAAILAVFANYRDKFTFRHLELWKKVVLAFIPVGLVGLLFHKQIKALFNVEVVATMFIIGGLVFLALEYFYKEKSVTVRDVEDLSYRQALWIGIAQLFALIPGTSRAGSTIIGALLVGLDRKASAEFSFLLALPVMAAASGFDLLRHYGEFNGSNLLVLSVGFVVSFFVAYLTMKLFIKFLERFTFVGFGIYRIGFGLLLLMLL
ncbi:MAG: undecaprenyl-diphosphate phosphatase [bacterium]|nr:undecaprenyl-diphosphate phosphatase [bacterium]